MKARTPPQVIQDQARIDPALLRVLADPLRSFIVYSVTPEAKTAKTLAAEMGCPTTRLYYHLRQLEKHGLVFVERTRLVSGIVEKHYRAVARDIRLDSAAFGTSAQPDRRRTEALLGFVFDQTRVEISRGIEAGTARAGAGEVVERAQGHRRFEQGLHGGIGGRLDQNGAPEEGGEQRGHGSPPERTRGGRAGEHEETRPGAATAAARAAVYATPRT